MPTYRDDGLVLRTHKLGEADRIITLLTRRHGKIRAVARGVRRTSSKFGGRLEPAGHVDLQLVEGRNLDTIAQAESLHSYGERLAGDYGRWTAAQVMLETADRLVVEEKNSSLSQFLLLQGALRTLGSGTPDGPRPPSMILSSYLMRALSLAGLAPALEECASCGGRGPHAWFSPVSGGLVCDRCRRSGAARPRPATLSLLVALRDGNWEATRAVDPAVVAETDGLVSAFTEWHLDHRLRSLRHVDRS